MSESTDRNIEKPAESAPEPTTPSKPGGNSARSGAVAQPQIVRIVQQIQRDRERVLDAFASARSPLMSAIQQLEDRQTYLQQLMNSVRVVDYYGALREGSGIKSTLEYYNELAKSPLLQSADSLARLQSSLEVGTYIETMMRQSAQWQGQPRAVDLAGLAATQVELTGWAVNAFPHRSLLVDTSAAAEQWHSLVLTQPDRSDLAVPVRSGRTTVALTGANLMVSLHEEEDAAEEAAVLVQSTVLAPWEAGRVELATELYTVLSGFDATVPDLLRGAWEDVTRQGPAAAEKAAHLAVEVVDRTLRAAAPDEQVLQWHKANGRSAKELHRERPTRALRVRYIAREFKDRALVAAHEDALAKLVSEVLESGQGVKHSSHGGVVIARSMLMAAETLLAQLFLRD
jgi:hypothetical protein